MLKQRIITALCLSFVVALCIIYLPPMALTAFFAVLVLIGAWEWGALAGLTAVRWRVAFVCSCIVLMWFSQSYAALIGDEISRQSTRDILGVGCLWWAVNLLWVKSYPASAPLWNSTAIRVVMGWLTLIPSWVALVYLRGLDGGIGLIFVLLGVVAAADIGAYFSGRRWGTSKLAAAVSPGKSWAGFWGGLIASSLFITTVWILWPQPTIALAATLAIVLVVSLASVLGDLSESMLKREVGIKDSGAILPGHGGILDRLDSLTAAAPVAALCLLLIEF